MDGVPPRAVGTFVVIALLTVDKALLVVHGLSAGVLAGASVHNALLSWRDLVSRRPTNARLQRLYPRVVAGAWLLTFGLGLVIYPPFRVTVRAEVFDVAMPLATGLFEMKEHWLALATLVLLYLVPSSAFIGRAGPPPVDRALYHLATIGVGAVVVYATIIGLTLAAIAPI
jgi:hypothetical protein